MDKGLRVLEVLVLVEFENLLIDVPYVRDPDHPLEIDLESFKLIVVFSLVVRDNGNSVF